MDVCSEGESEFPRGVSLDQDSKTEIKTHHHTPLKAKADDLQSHLPKPQRHAMKPACEKGGFSILTTIFTSEHCWPLTDLSLTHPCGSNLTIIISLHDISLPLAKYSSAH